MMRPPGGQVAWSAAKFAGEPEYGCTFTPHFAGSHPNAKVATLSSTTLLVHGGTISFIAFNMLNTFYCNCVSSFIDPSLGADI